MPGDKVRADYDELAKTANLWQRESESCGQMLATLRREMASLQGGDWVGPGATAFYAEMNTAVLPAVQRLTSALSEAGQVTRRISTIVKTAEGDAARVLRGTGADEKLPAMGVSKDQVQPSGSSAGAIAGGVIGAVFGGPLGAILGAGVGSQFDNGPDTGGSFVKLSDSPKTVEVPKVLNDGLADAWKDSFPNGRSQEQGGMLVQKGDGTLEFRRGAAGDSGSFSPNYGDLKDGETLIGLVHTHPYDATEGGHTDVSFSGADIANLVSRRDPMKMVQSGDGQFMVIRTQEFDARVNKLDDAGKQQLYDDMKADYQRVFNQDTDKHTFAERNDRAAESVAKKYDLAYYTGKNGSLNRKTP